MTKFCSNCGKEVADQAFICPGCGCKVGQETQADGGHDSGLLTAAKVFMILTIVACGWTLIPLAWLIPMTVKIFGRSKSSQPLGTGFKVCVLLFANVLAGIFLLCDNEA